MVNNAYRKNSDEQGGSCGTAYQKDWYGKKHKVEISKPFSWQPTGKSTLPRRWNV